MVNTYRFSTYARIAMTHSACNWMNSALFTRAFVFWILCGNCFYRSKLPIRVRFNA